MIACDTESMKSESGTECKPEQTIRWKKGSVTLLSIAATVTSFLFTGLPGALAETDNSPAASLSGLKFEMLAYIDYSNGMTPTRGGEQAFNKFTLTRGYFTVKKTITPWLSARITTDITRDEDENWESRLKYLYAELSPGDLGLLTNMKAEIGQGHIPWLDFEEHVNPYRCQGTMAIERAHILNSADLGVSIRGNLAGKMKDVRAKTGNHHYDGLYGSWHVGIYNGGGYHAKEKNKNKVLEGRLTLRPLPDFIPGLQVSYFGIYGKGNNADSEPDYTVNLGMLSYEHPRLILTAQYFATEGNAGGSYSKEVNGKNTALGTNGYSFFGNATVIKNKFSIFGRYDYFDADVNHDIWSDAIYAMYIAGVSYRVFDGNMILLDFETTDYNKNSGGKDKPPISNEDIDEGATKSLGDDYKVQVVWQAKF